MMQESIPPSYRGRYDVAETVKQRSGTKASPDKAVKLAARLDFATHLTKPNISGPDVEAMRPNRLTNNEPSVSR